MVGCVIVTGGRVIGEGFTSPYGGPHAEVNAINSVRDKSALREATLYVSLEPCSHFGKTPPCTQLILDSGIKEVVIGIGDPHSKVAGKGIEQLREGGCKVITPVLEQPCRAHHKRFLTFHEKGRPYIILKWAQSQDGFLAPDPDKRGGDAKPYWISNPLSRQLVHQWRSEEQGILVGAQTVIADNPSLTVRDWGGKDPVRIVWDTHGQLGGEFNLFNQEGRTLVATSRPDGSGPGEVVPLPGEASDSPGLAVLQALHQKDIQSVLVEGGARTLQTFIQEGLWDEARVFSGPVTLGSGIAAPRLNGRLVGSEFIGNDLLSYYRND